MSSQNFVTQIMSPGGGILLIPFTRAVIICLFLTTFTVFVLGVARVHMFILSALSIGFYFALGKFEREYRAFLNRDVDRVFATPTSSSVATSIGEEKEEKETRSLRRRVTTLKRED